MPLRRACCLLLLLLTFPAGVAHAMPRVTLKADQTTLDGVLSQLRKQLSWNLGGPNGEGNPGFAPSPNAKRASFDWRDAPLGRVCREIGEAYGVTPVHHGGSSIYFNGNPMPKGARPCSVTREANQFVVTQVGQNESRALQPGDGAPTVSRSMSLSLALRPLDGDPERFHSLTEIRATDDLGNDLRPTQNQVLRRDTGGGGRPDEWVAYVSFGDYDPRASKIARFEAHAILYRRLWAERVEVPLVDAKLPFEKGVGPFRLKVTEIKSTGGNNVQVKCEAVWPQGVEANNPSQGYRDQPYPSLLMRNGGFGYANITDYNRREDGATWTVHVQNVAPGNQSPVALVWDMVVKADPERPIPIRIDNIPLPRAQGAAPPPAPGVKPAINRADAGTGRMSSAVIVGDQPARAGQLALGLSKKQPDGRWGPVRWHTAEVDERGTATVEKIAPGTYRVLRTFRVRNEMGDLLPPAGQWSNQTVTVTVQPGKATSLPPLKRLR